MGTSWHIHWNAVAHDDLAALHNVLVCLGIVEMPDPRPHDVDRGIDGLDDDKAALVGPHRVGMLASGSFWKQKAELSKGEEKAVCGLLQMVGCGYGGR